jgi:uncharacterized protein
MQRRHLLTLMASLALTQSPTAQTLQDHKPITWDQLIPHGWQPSKYLQLLGQRLQAWSDSSKAAHSYLSKLRKEWDQAPATTSFDGQRIRIPGFVVPLDVNAQQTRELLLVPYFGACIHSPPPPANQIIYIQLEKSTPLESMATVWAQGILRAQRGSHGETVAGYTLSNAELSPYQD